MEEEKERERGRDVRFLPTLKKSLEINGPDNTKLQNYVNLVALQISAPPCIHTSEKNVWWVADQ